MNPKGEYAERKVQSGVQWSTTVPNSREAAIDRSPRRKPFRKWNAPHRAKDKFDKVYGDDQSQSKP
jgi:hypothetical protein